MNFHQRTTLFGIAIFLVGLMLIFLFINLQLAALAAVTMPVSMLIWMVWCQYRERIRISKMKQWRIERGWEPYER